MSSAVSRRALAAALVALGACVACDGVVIDGPPSVECGIGLYAFEPVEPGQVVPITYLLQGGTVLYLALRVRDMHPRNMTVEAWATLAADGTAVGGPHTFEITLARGEDDEWIYAGLPIEVDPMVVGGQLLLLELELVDQDGRIGLDSVEIVAQ